MAFQATLQAPTPDRIPANFHYPDPAPAMMPPALGWDTLMVDPPQGHLAANAQASRRHRHRGNVFGQGWTLAPTPRDFTGTANFAHPALVLFGFSG